MDFDMPTDLINQCQIEFRERAGLSSFDPSDTTLPSPPTVEASISSLDPSPPYLRCKLCQGKLLRGLQSLICVYCGEYQKKDLHPDPISFNSTNGFSWLLQSLNLNGSERVGCLAEGNGVHGGRTPAEDIVSLSELLDLQISWRDNPKKLDSSFNNKVSEHISPLDPGTTNLDDFFTERFASNASEEQQVSSNQDQSKGFETSVPSSIDVNDDDDWNAEFQFADSNDNPKPVDPFVGAEIETETETETDLSAHMDAVFGQMEGLSNVKPNEDKGWDDDDLFANMGPTTFQQAGQVDSVVEDEPKDEISGHVNDLSSSKEVEHDLFSDGNWQTSSAHKNDTSQESGSVDWFENADWQKSGKKDFENKSSDIDNSKKQDLETNNDWFQESQWSTGSTKTVVKQEDDEFDDWNDFTSSTGNQDSWKQNSNEKTEKKAELDLFSSTQEVDFGMFPESSTANRNVNGEDGNSKNTPNGNDVEMLMSQMHDLSFMLKSELSIPSKPTDDDDFGFSHS